MSLAAAVEFSIATRTTDSLAKTGPGRVRNVTLSGTAAANWVLRDGTDSSGTDIGNFELTAAGNVAIEWPMQFQTGLFLDLVSGAGRITVVYE